MSLTIMRTAGVYTGVISCLLSKIKPTPYQKAKAYVAYMMSHITPLPIPEYIPFLLPVFLAGLRRTAYLKK